MAQAPAAPAGGWILQAVRSVLVMAFVMGSIVATVVGAASLATRARPSYTEAVVEPAQAMLTQHQALVLQAEQQALSGSPAQARGVLAEVRAQEEAFARDVLAAGPPQAPELRGLDDALRSLYALLDDGLGLALRCLDDLQAGVHAADSQACRDGWARLAEVPARVQAVLDAAAALQGQLQA